jgi:hypothetical protein
MSDVVRKTDEAEREADRRLMLDQVRHHKEATEKEEKLRTVFKLKNMEVNKVLHSQIEEKKNRLRQEQEQDRLLIENALKKDQALKQKME